MDALQIITLVAMILVAGGVASRLAIWITRASWNGRAKWLLSMVVSAVFGLATAWLAGDVFDLTAAWGSLTAAQAFAFMGTVFATSSGFYALWFKPRAIARQ